MAVTLAISGAVAQTSLDKPPSGSVSGVVKDAGSGAPISDAAIALSGVTVRYASAKTDSQGKYAVRNLEPGLYRIEVTAPKRQSARRTVTLAAGRELASINFELVSPASVSGTVVDENREPLPGIYVELIAREYYLGTARYVLAGLGHTDDRGQYAIGVRPDRAYLLLARKRASNLDARSETPLDPKQRRPVPAPTYYPNSPSAAGSAPLVLRPGEQRSGIEIKMARTPAFCLEALTAAGGAPSPMNFEVQTEEPALGSVSSGGMFGFAPRGMSPAGGRIRICELHPGQYRLVTWGDVDQSVGTPAFHGVTPFTIGDRDVRDARAIAIPPTSLSGEVGWADPEPGPASDLKVAISLKPLTRGRWVGEGKEVQVTVPGQFTLERIFVDDYALNVAVDAPGVYVKDITYGSVSILNAPFRPGSAPGNAGPRILLARDGGSLDVRVADKDGNPVGDSSVYAMPAGVQSEAALSALLVSGVTDQEGQFRSGAPLPPGKYFVLATSTRVTFSADNIASLWRARSKAVEIEIKPRAAASATLQPVSLDQER